MRHLLKFALLCLSLVTITLGLVRTLSPDAARACITLYVNCANNGGCKNMGLGSSEDCTMCSGVIGACYGFYNQPGYAGEDCTCGSSCPTPPGGCGSSPNGTCCDATNVTSQTFNAGNGGTCSASCNGQCYYWEQTTACGWQVSPTACNPAPTIPVVGWKTQMPGNIQPAAGSTIATQQVTAGGYASTANPYTLSAPGSCTYPVNLNISAVIPPTYSVGYTQCNSTQANCTINDTPASPNFYNAGIPQTGGNLWYNPGPGNTNAVTTISVAGTSATPTQNSSPSTVDLWWHYCSVWTNLGACQPPLGQTCGPGGTQIQTDNCGNTRTVACTTVCTFFQTFGGDVTFKGNLSNTQLPSSNYYVSGR